MLFGPCFKTGQIRLFRHDRETADHVKHCTLVDTATHTVCYSATSSKPPNATIAAYQSSISVALGLGASFEDRTLVFSRNTNRPWHLKTLGTYNEPYTLSGGFTTPYDAINPQISGNAPKMTRLIRFALSNFTYLLTLFSKFFSSFPHGTCSLSVSRQYLALDGAYHPFSAGVPTYTTLCNASVRGR